MTEPTPDILNDIEKPIVSYSTFWQRFFASIIDGLILSPVIIVDSFNKTTWKSYPILAISFLFALLYKPFLEAKYGATVGKMALKLTVVNAGYQKAGIKNIVLRNIFDIVSRLSIWVITVITFASAGFDKVTTLGEYGKLSNAETGSIWVTLVMTIIVLVDAIVLIADSRKQSLHDKIGQTFVIQK